MVAQEGEVAVRATSKSGAQVVAAALLAWPMFLGDPVDAAYRPWPLLPKTINVDAASWRVSLGSQFEFLEARQEGTSKLDLTVTTDLSLLQRNPSAFLHLPEENCRTFSADNVVLSIENSMLAVEDGKLKLNLKGNASIWMCTENPIPNSNVVWEEKQVGLGIRTRVPVVQTWPGSPIKSRLAVQPYTMSSTFSFQIGSDGGVQVDVANDIRAPVVEGLKMKIPVPNSLVGSTTNTKFFLQNISESSLKALPPAFREMAFLATSAAFAIKDGKLVATLVYSARLASAQAEVLRQSLLTEADIPRN